MDKFRIGHYQITPQVDEGETVRVKVQRDPNPHNIAAIHVCALLHVEPEGTIRYQVQGPAGQEGYRSHRTWELSINDAMRHIEVAHKNCEDAIAAEKGEITRQQGNKQIAVDELKLFVSQLEDCEVG